ncbi:MBL fold metallo-hydrolase [Pseudoroseomonas globiformis]|uniref:MBL fold metallo-hydrolase n=1 Tax=Teichococcus globiformis TaxID=2307229 RepID=A0ABV7G1X5_9PROT
MADRIPLPEEARAPENPAGPDDGIHHLAPDLAYARLMIVNVAFLGLPDSGDRGWVLVDAGLPGTKGTIREAAARRFGSTARPAAILLTHGHFDHVGVLEDLAEEWDVPVYAHPLEKPYLDGSAAYPPPAPEVGGGLMARLSPLFPRKPLDLGARLHMLPQDGTLPFAPGWRWLHTPGHSVGHVSFWREADRSLVAGDAVVTTRQESAYAAVAQTPELHGPPAYFTVDWEAAAQSARQLSTLEPETMVAGHGRAMAGPALRSALHELAANFERLGMPERTRYAEAPARAEDGSAYPKP